MNVFPVPVALPVSVPPITSVSAIILKVLEFTVTPVTLPPTDPSPSPILNALEPQLLNVFPVIVTVVIVVSVVSTTGKSVMKATWLPPE